MQLFPERSCIAQVSLTLATVALATFLIGFMFLLLVPQGVSCADGSNQCPADQVQLNGMAKFGAVGYGVSATVMGAAFSGAIITGAWALGAYTVAGLSTAMASDNE